MDREVEARLVAALARGDEAAFVPVYEAYRSRVFTFILRMVDRREIAEELSQEVWLRLAAQASSLRPDSRLEAWLFAVARNLCISYWRTRGIEGFEDSSPDVMEHLDADDPPPDEQARSREQHARLERGLARLPRPYREALLLIGVEGMAPSTAAAVCGISPEAMRKRLERARKMLAELLGTSRTNRVIHEAER